MSVVVAMEAGFVFGGIAGLAAASRSSPSFGALATAGETALTTAAGAGIGWLMGSLGGQTAAALVACVAGMNGFAGGLHAVYDWRAVRGWFAFLSDSTWAIVGTTLGVLIFAINSILPKATLVEDFSRRQNRHVYDGGVALKSLFAFTQGSYISNANPTGRGLNATFLKRHEELHIWQSRMFGPFFQTTYAVWAIAGFFWALVVWLRNRGESFGQLLMTATYFNNPFEYWAYCNDEYWPPNDAHPLIAYGRAWKASDAQPVHDEQIT